MSIKATERSHKFTFMPSQLQPVTEEQELATIYRRTGVYPYPKAKQEWITKEARRRQESDEDFNTEQLAKQYDSLKADGKL
ncbi:hypothetical protein AALA26_03725 [Bifidobacterium pseudolongum]|uniref:Uncharacterized protein n=1 Tax=Bifidobacterium pseudolongum TaxID=1694 RepID=A0AB37P0N5_9BIFI|nr:hypothetical protein [Bifidobacterium pseudolongum]NBH69369.1 hypothetical protein [Bifidobacterium pseudolongum]RKI88243.1 hypothetical protein D7V89_04135 [Bifidobacterium pseudolongum]